MPKLSPASMKFILHWGEMGTRWGINRTVAQVHALLYISPQPLHAEDITEALGVARSHVSNSLKDLRGWGIIRTIHLPGDRRDHFESLKDVWEMFRAVLDERKKREIDPTLELLKDCVAEVERIAKPDAEDMQVRERLGQLLDFFETMGGWYDQIQRLPTPAVIRFVKLGDKVRKLLGLTGRAAKERESGSS